MGLALLLRLWVNSGLAGAPSAPLLLGDASYYARQAQDIADGGWWGDAVFYQAPLYPYFMATVQTLLGDGLGPLRLVQAVLGAAGVGALALAGGRLWGRPAGLVAAALYALHPMALYFGFLVSKSALDGPLLCALLLGAAHCLHQPSRRALLATGAIAGLLALSRQNTLVLVPVLLLFIGGGRAALGQRLQRMAWTLGGLAAVLTPVCLRNWAVGGDFTLTQSRLGPNLFIGNNPEATGSYVPLVPGRANFEFELADATALAEAAVGRSLGPSEVSAHWVGRVVDWVQAAPMDWLGLLGTKLLMLLNALELGDTETVYAASEHAPLLVGSLAFLGMGTLLPLALGGLVLTLGPDRKSTLVPALALVYGASVVAFFVFDRFRFPLVPLLCLMAGGGLAALPGLVRQRALPRLAGAGLVVGLGAALSQLPLDWNHPHHTRRAEHGRSLLVTASSLQRHGGDPATVDALCQQAIRIWPDDPFPRIIAGELRAGREDLSAAAAHYQAALDLAPQSTSAHAHMGGLLVRVQGPAAALPHFAQAARSGAPADIGNLARALAETGQIPASLEVLDRALARAPAPSLAQLRADVLALQAQAPTPGPSNPGAGLGPEQ